MAEEQLSALAEVLTGQTPDTLAEEPEASPPFEREEQAGEHTTDSAPVEEPESPEPEREQGDFGELYDKVVPGTELTLGELKDQAKQYAEATQLTETAKHERSELERERLLLQQRAQELTAMLPEGAVTPEKLAEADRQIQARMEQAAQEMVRIIPDWSNAETKAADVATMAEHLAGYGVSPAIVEQLTNTDPTLTKILLDAARLSRSAKQATKQVKKAPRRKQGGNRGTKAPGNSVRQLKTDIAAGKITQDQAALKLLLGD